MRGGVAPLKEILAKALEGVPLSREEGLRIIDAREAEMPDVLHAARILRDRGRGKRVSFSKKVFIPLTNLCRDYCGYCTFRRNPGQSGAHTMTPDEVLAVAEAGARMGCKEVLFSLGDRPEAIFPEHQKTLKRLGHRTTLDYLRAMCALLMKETPLLPHANPGLMERRDLEVLREVNASMGLMLENVSDRLGQAGGPHAHAPDKVPRLRLKTIESAGQLRIAFTTGILIGIGERRVERVESLLAIRQLHDRYGHIQEVIIQNFRANPETPMRDHSEPTLDELLRTLTCARLLLGGGMNIQAPPNLTPGEYPLLISAGLNDWGGISPVTKDFINPQAPWPLIPALRRATEAAGMELRERLAIYPEYLTKRAGFLAEPLRAKVSAYADEEGFVASGPERWREWEG